MNGLFSQFIGLGVLLVSVGVIYLITNIWLSS